MADQKEEKMNPFRDTPIRLLGYANELGESFRHQIPKSAVHGTYAISITYALCDASFLSRRTYTNVPEGTTSSRRLLLTTNTFVESLMWQLCASVMIPGFVINRIVHTTRNQVIPRSPALQTPGMKRWLPTVLGLASIPLIVKPIDHSVDWAFENVYEPLAHKLIGEDDK